jgi:hypothetical protein
VLSRLREVGGGHRLLLRAILLLVAIVAAYNYSLPTLVRGLSLETPLAYLGLVPFIALLLVVLRGLAPDSGPDIRDRHADYIVGKIGKLELSPPPVVPEAPFAFLLPLGGGGVLTASLLLLSRRRRRMDEAVN